MSNLAVVAILLAGLSGAALLNHAVHGVGTTDPVWVVGMVFLLGFPTGALVGGVTLGLQSSSRFDGTLGTVVYFFAAVAGLVLILPAIDGSAPSELSLSLRTLDLSGFLTSHALLFDTLAEAVPGYNDGPPSFGQGYADGRTETFRFTGGPIPSWVFLNRLVLLGLGLLAVLVATVPYDRFEQTRETPSLGRRIAASMGGLLGRSDDGADPTTTTPDTDSLTPVTDRSAGGFLRLLRQELLLWFRFGLAGG